MSIASTHFATGMTVGTGAALNISCGFVPRRVEVYNITDHDIITVGFPDWHIPFTSGGTYEIKVGDLIIGGTTGARARVAEINLLSGTWAGGDAAGTFIIRPEDLTGTFGSENVSVVASGTTNDATVTVNVSICYLINTATATATGTSAITAFVGSSTAAAGFTLGSVVSESAKELRWTAWR